MKSGAFTGVGIALAAIGTVGGLIAAILSGSFVLFLAGTVSGILGGLLFFGIGMILEHLEYLTACQEEANRPPPPSGPKIPERKPDLSKIPPVVTRSRYE